MRKFPVLAAAALLVSLAGTAAVVTAADKPATDKKATSQPADPKAGPPVNKFCAVQGADNKVDPDVFVIYKGKKVGFCCKDCIEEFNKDPEKYVKSMK
jgi:hypothetical protein